MTRYVAMIPARLGSKRVKKKNLRMLGDKPLIAHVIETACRSEEFDDVYVNSESEIFQPIAEQYGAKFYKRPEALAADDATNDQFALDFMSHVPCDVLVQINPTAPFVGLYEIEETKRMFEKGCDTVLAVEERRIEGVINNLPVNWNPKAPMPPSQLLEPVYLFSNGILAWRVEVFQQNIKNLGCAVYGGAGKTGYCVFSGDAALDIDNEEDFAFAEILLERKKRSPAPAEYWGEKHVESEVSDILAKDGVKGVDLDDVNHDVLHLPDVVNSLPRDRSSSKRIINSPSNSATVISQMPGEGNRRHYHPSWDEWWLILEGQWEYEVEGQKRTVEQGDVVFIERNRLHRITAVGSSRAIRLAVSRDGEPHIYPE